jgi:hypothetical protein
VASAPAACEGASIPWIESLDQMNDGLIHTMTEQIGSCDSAASIHDPLIAHILGTLQHPVSLVVAAACDPKHCDLLVHAANVASERSGYHGDVGMAVGRQHRDSNSLGWWAWPSQHDPDQSGQLMTMNDEPTASGGGFRLF